MSVTASQRVLNQPGFEPVLLAVMEHLDAKSILNLSEVSQYLNDIVVENPTTQLRLREEFHSIERSFVETLGPTPQARLESLIRSEAAWADLSPSAWCLIDLSLPDAPVRTLTAGNMMFQFQPTLVHDDENHLSYQLNGTVANRICVFDIGTRAMMRWWRVMPGPPGDLLFYDMDADPDQDLVITVTSDLYSAIPLDAPPVLGPGGEPEPRSLSLRMSVHPWHLNPAPVGAKGSQGVWEPHPAAASHTDQTGATDIVRHVSADVPYEVDVQEFRNYHHLDSRIGPDGTLLLSYRNGMHEVWDWRTAEVLLAFRMAHENVHQSHAYILDRTTVLVLAVKAPVNDDGLYVQRLLVASLLRVVPPSDTPYEAPSGLYSEGSNGYVEVGTLSFPPSKIPVVYTFRGGAGSAAVKITIQSPLGAALGPAYAQMLALFLPLLRARMEAVAAEHEAHGRVPHAALGVHDVKGCIEWGDADLEDHYEPELVTTRDCEVIMLLATNALHPPVPASFGPDHSDPAFNVTSLGVGILGKHAAAMVARNKAGLSNFTGRLGARHPQPLDTRTDVRERIGRDPQHQSDLYAHAANSLASTERFLNPAWDPDLPGPAAEETTTEHNLLLDATTNDIPDRLFYPGDGDPFVPEAPATPTDPAAEAPAPKEPADSSMPPGRELSVLSGETTQPPPTGGAAHSPAETSGAEAPGGPAGALGAPDAPDASAAELEVDAAEPDAAEPDAAEPDAPEPDAAEPDADPPATADSAGQTVKRLWTTCYITQSWSIPTNAEETIVLHLLEGEEGHMAPARGEEPPAEGDDAAANEGGDPAAAAAGSEGLRQAGAAAEPEPSAAAAEPSDAPDPVAAPTAAAAAAPAPAAGSAMPESAAPVTTEQALPAGLAEPGTGEPDVAAGEPDAAAGPNAAEADGNVTDWTELLVSAFKKPSYATPENVTRPGSAAIMFTDKELGLPVAINAERHRIYITFEDYLLYLKF